MKTKPTYDNRNTFWLSGILLWILFATANLWHWWLQRREILLRAYRWPAANCKQGLDYRVSYLHFSHVGKLHPEQCIPSDSFFVANFFGSLFDLVSPDTAEPFEEKLRKFLIGILERYSTQLAFRIRRIPV